MKLNIHSPFSHIYRIFYNTSKLPKNLCLYFWKLIFALICSPLIWPVFLLNINSIKYNKKYKYYYNANSISTFYGVLINCVIFVIGIIYCAIYYGNNMLYYLSILDVYTNGIIFTLCSFLILKLIIYFISKSKKVLTNEEYRERYLKSETKIRLKESKKLKSFWYITWTYLKTWKDNCCPIITWIDNKDN